MRIPAHIRVIAAGAVALAGLIAVYPETASSAATVKLPYPGGVTYRLSQANNGSSHQGIGYYAFDFAMPTGSAVAAVRDGRVTMTKQNSDIGGCSSAYGTSANYVVIDHGDATQSLYLHLQYNSVVVRVGDTVRQGQTIARSGNTGWSCGPHLHFQVERTGSSWWTQSLPTIFADVTTNNGMPIVGQSYTSGNYLTSATPTATASPSPTATATSEPGKPEPPTPTVTGTPAPKPGFPTATATPSPTSTATATPTATPPNSCSGTACNGQDPEVVGCAAGPITAAEQTATFGSGASAVTVLIESRWSGTCQTNWARARVVSSPVGSSPITLSVRLEDAANVTLPGTSAQETGAFAYGNMWFAPTQPVKACVQVDGPVRGSVCTRAV